MLSLFPERLQSGWESWDVAPDSAASPQTKVGLFLAAEDSLCVVVCLR